MSHPLDSSQRMDVEVLYLLIALNPDGEDKRKLLNRKAHDYGPDSDWRVRHQARLAWSATPDELERRIAHLTDPPHRVKPAPTTLANQTAEVNQRVKQMWFRVQPNLPKRAAPSTQLGTPPSLGYQARPTRSQPVCSDPSQVVFGAWGQHGFTSK